MRGSALAYAAYYGHLTIVQYLIKKGADIHAMNDEAVIFAARNGHLDVVKYLVVMGAYIRAANDYALRYSAECGHVNVVKYLLYETCFGKTNDFGFKYDLIKPHAVVSHFRSERDRRKKIQLELAEEIPQYALHFHFRPTSLRILCTGAYFGRDFLDRQYWE